MCVGHCHAQVRRRMQLAKARFGRAYVRRVFLWGSNIMSATGACFHQSRSTSNAALVTEC